MESVTLLSPTDINLIRRYVHTKYAPLPGERQAEIVADAIRRTLQQRLPAIPQEMKNTMTDRLISQCLVGEQRDVSPEDVLDLCSELDMDEADRHEQLVNPVMDWAKERMPGKWSPEQLSSRLERKQMYAIVLPTELTGGELKPDKKSLSWTAIASHWMPYIRRFKLPNPGWVLFAAVIISAIGTTILLNQSAKPTEEVVKSPPIVVAAPAVIDVPDLGMPEPLTYADFDENALKTYLNSREALLVEEPYFSTIVASAQKYDIHPYLLFAITGQEQGFVPKSSKDATKKANNPFNVFHSWEDYNTDIQNSSEIAAKLLVKLANSRPEGHEPFSWFNKTYAEDPLWSVGVEKLFNKLSSLPPSSE